MSFYSNPQEQEYVTIPLSTPERKTLQNLLQLIPSSSRFNTSQNDPPPRFNLQNPPFSGKRSKNKRKNRSKNRFQQGNYQNYQQNQQNPLAFRQRRSENLFPQRFQSPVKQTVQTPGKEVNLSNPLITPLLLAVLTQAKKMSVSKDQAKQSPAPFGSQHGNFQYSSRLNSASKSRSPGMLQDRRKSVRWADLETSRSSSRNGSPNKGRIGFIGNYNLNSGISRMNLKAQMRAERKGLIQTRDDDAEPLPTTSEYPPRVLKSILKHKETPVQVENQPEPVEIVEQPVKTIVHKETPRKPSTGKRSMPKSFNNGSIVWMCPNPKCRAGNTSQRTICFKCGMFRPAGLEEGEISMRTGPIFKKGDWNCEECDNLNFARRSNCNICSAPRPIETYEDFRPRKRVNRENEAQQQEKQELNNIEQIPLTESVEV